MMESEIYFSRRKKILMSIYIFYIAYPSIWNTLYISDADIHIPRIVIEIRVVREE